MKSLEKAIVAIFSLVVSAALASAAGIQGIVRGADGKVAKGLDVRLESKTGHGQAQSTKTDDAGRYSFSNLASGPYKVTIMSGSQTKAFMDNVMPGSPKRLDFDLRTAAAGKPAKKAKHLVWVPADTGSHIGGRWVEADDATDNQSGTERVEKKSGQALQKMNSQGASANPNAGGH